MPMNSDFCLGNQKSSLVEWLNCMVPHLRLPLGASVEEMRACLIDGTVLCTVLNQLCPGCIEMVGLQFILSVYLWPLLSLTCAILYDFRYMFCLYLFLFWCFLIAQTWNSILAL